MFQGHGDDRYLHNQPVTADFSTNVWHGGAPAGLKEHLIENWVKVQRYPEVLGESLTAKIAAHYNFPADSILVTNGSTESIYLIAQAFCHKKSAIAIPAFAEYEDACKMHGHEITFVHWNKLKAGEFPQEADLVFICNPNNPTGEVLTDLETFLKKKINTLFVVDEAFIEFTSSITSLVKLVESYPNLIVLRSMTKAYTIPGLRLGYICAQPFLINLLKTAKLPWSVNALALEAGHFIFDHFNTLQLPLQQLLSAKADFVQQLENSGLSVYPSHTHFFLAEIPAGTAAGLKEYLLKRFNLLIRNAENFRGLNAQHIRIATLSPEKNNLLISALEQWKHTLL